MNRRDIIERSACSLGGAWLAAQKLHAETLCEVDPIGFRNTGSEAGLNFVPQNRPTPEKHEIETMPGGVAAFDYNGNGLTDVYFTNGTSTRSLEKDSPRYSNRLFRNESGMKFRDVNHEAGDRRVGSGLLISETLV